MKQIISILFFILLCSTGFTQNAKEFYNAGNEKLDHKNLNIDVDFMQGRLCSIENLITAIWEQLIAHLPAGVQLHALKLYETPRIYVEYFGD